MTWPQAAALLAVCAGVDGVPGVALVVALIALDVALRAGGAW